MSDDESETSYNNENIVLNQSQIIPLTIGRTTRRRQQTTIQTINQTINQMNYDGMNGETNSIQDIPSIQSIHTTYESMGVDPNGYSPADLRRQANRLIQQKRRAKETEDARARRLAAEAYARRLARANETEEQRRERLRKNAEHIRLVRAMETQEETEVRRQRMAMSRRVARERESEEERNERLRRAAEARRLYRQNESEEVKASRRAREALARRIARANETDEERQERRRKAAEARRRASVSSSDDGMVVVDHVTEDGNIASEESKEQHHNITAAHRLARATESKDSREKRLRRYDEAHPGGRSSLPLSAEVAYYEGGHESEGDYSQTIVAVNPMDSEAARQQIFKKKFRPHNTSTLPLEVDTTVIPRTQNESSDDEATFIIRQPYHLGTNNNTTNNSNNSSSSTSISTSISTSNGNGDDGSGTSVAQVIAEDININTNTNININTNINTSKSHVKRAYKKKS